MADLKRYLLSLLFFSCCLLPYLAQKTLAIDIYRLGHFRRIHVYQNDELVYKLKGSSHKHKQRIVDMGDSVLFIETGESIRLDQIKKIIIDRSNFLTRMLAYGLRVGGAGCIAIDAFNNAKNNDLPIFRERVLIVGASLFVAGEILHLANKRRLRPGNNTHLQILDLSPI